MIAEMAKKKHTELARLIMRGREAAGSLTKLIEDLGDPLLKVRTVEEWEQERREPPDYVAASVIQRIKKYLGD